MPDDIGVGSRDTRRILDALAALGPQLEGLRTTRMDHSLRRELDQIHEMVGEIREVENKYSQALTLLDHRTGSMQTVLAKLEALVRGNGMIGLSERANVSERRIKELEDGFDQAGFKFETRTREFFKMSGQIVIAVLTALAALYAAGKL